MANLLPDQYRQGVRKEYKLRLTAGGLGLMVICLVVGIALLIPSFLLVGNRKQQLQSTLASLPDQKATTTEKLKSVILQTNQKITAATKAYRKQILPTHILTTITSNQPNGVSLRRIVIRQDNKQRMKVKVTGIAATREALINFEETLRQNSQIASVNLPIDVLASRQKTEFSMGVVFAKS